MVDENGPHGDGAYDDARYYGPFGEASPGPSYQQPYATPTWDPPTTTPSVLAQPPTTPPSAPRRRSLRPAAVIGIAAATAVLVGGGAGYGGAKLAGGGSTAAPVPATSTSVEPSATPTPSATPLPPAPSTANTVEVAKRALPGTVMIQAGNATGSGFVLDTDGRIMTNNHVVAGADGKIRVVFSDGKRQTATLVGRSPSYDIAVIKVKASTSLKPIAAGNSDQTEVGQPVIAIGSPLGLPGTVTQGIVSARNRPVAVGGGDDADAKTAYINAIQTDASINPGNSGGPMVDAEARVIGVNSAILTLGSAQTQTGNIGLGFAIPINQARAIGDQLIAKGKATYPVLGANVRTASGGVELTSVEGNGPAAKAGLRKGDLITKVDGQSVREMDELIVTIRTRRPGQVVALDYTRDSSGDQVRVKLGSRVG
ncbi:MAG TPA: trypsin-like peptidase domain-containing protein [Propionibacteriaceae bacterium]